MRLSSLVLCLFATACQREERSGDPVTPDAAGKPRTPGPDEAAIYAVPVDGDPAWGPPAALVTVVEAAEFTCPFSHAALPVLAALKAEHGDALRIVWKDFIVHPTVGTLPALAGCAAGRQGKFWELSSAIWKGWQGGAPGDLSRAALVSLAGELGLDGKRFEQDLDSEGCQKGLEADRAALRRLGVRATPSFFVNGRYAKADDLGRLVAEERARAAAAIRNGVRPEEIYPAILANGKKTF
jgi:protein-disulfide isomerase